MVWINPRRNGALLLDTSRQCLPDSTHPTPRFWGSTQTYDIRVQVYLWWYPQKLRFLTTQGNHNLRWFRATAMFSTLSWYPHGRLVSCCPFSCVTATYQQNCVAEHSWIFQQRMFTPMFDMWKLRMLADFYLQPYMHRHIRTHIYIYK